MSEFFVLLLMQVTIFSSVTACIIILVKQLFKWVIPPGVGVLMWVILLLRLLWPIFPESPVSVYNLIPAGRSIMYTLTNNIDEELSRQDEIQAEQANPYVLSGEDYSHTEVKNRTVTSKQLYPETGVRQTVGEYLSDAIYAGRTKSENASLAKSFNISLLAIYAFGTVAAIGINWVIYRRAKKNALSAALMCTDERTLAVYYDTAKKLGIKEKKIPELRYGTSSMLVGCYAPVVIFREQEGLSDRELSMVFAHELNHFKHKDNFVLVFSTFMSCFFWYNPLIWIVRNMLRQDIEIMCDARTISDREIKKTEYAQFIYESSAENRRTLWAGCHMSMRSRQLKERLRNISRNLENKVIPRILSSVICVCIIVVCLTNPIISQNIQYKDYIGNYSELTGESEQTMHLTSNVTVSYYLKQIDAILSENYDVAVSKTIGNGSLENLKRLIHSGDYVEKGVAERIDALRSDQTLNVENCALLNQCIVALLTGGEELDHTATLPLLPKYISAEKMNTLLSMISEEDGELLLKSYNRGVAGADVKLEAYYTVEMFKLILSRMDSEESKRLWSSYYIEVDLSSEYNMDMVCNRMTLTPEELAGEEYLYIVTPTVTLNDKKILHGLIKSAYAGQNESVYYLKQDIGGYSEFAIRRILTDSGYDLNGMITEYARLGIPQYEHFTVRSSRYLNETQYEIIDIRLDGSGYNAYDLYTNIEDTEFYVLNSPYSAEATDAISYLNAISFVPVRNYADGGITVRGIGDEDVKEAVLRMYNFGLIDDEEGVLNLESPISCGQSLYYSYKLVCSIVNANR